jgi:hypothetical protein
MTAKCNCNQCSQPIEFPAEMAGQTVQCPTCKMETVLFIPSDKAKPSSPKNFVPSTSPISPTKIEEKLEIIGYGFFILGLIGATAAFVDSFLRLYSFADLRGVDEYQTEKLIGCVVVAVICLIQGFIMQNLFRALAEIIRLLRRLVWKK